MILLAYDSTNNVSYNFMVSNYLVIIKKLVNRKNNNCKRKLDNVIKNS